MCKLFSGLILAKQYMEAVFRRFHKTAVVKKFTKFTRSL